MIPVSVDLHLHLNELLAAASKPIVNYMVMTETRMTRFVLFEYGQVLFCMCLAFPQK